MNWKIIRIVDTYIGIPLMYLLVCLRKLFRFSFHDPARKEYKRILLVKFWGIGNIFMMLPSAEALRNTYPDAELDLLTLETNLDAALATGAFNNVYVLDARDIFIFTATSLRNGIMLRRRGYAFILDFEQFAKFSAVFCAMIGKNDRIGFNTEGQHRHFLYTHTVPYDNSIHITRSYKALTNIAGVASTDTGVLRTVAGQPSGDILCSDVAAKLGISIDRLLVVMHVGTSSNSRERRWPEKYFAALADLLIGRHDVQLVITGLKDEASIASGVISNTHCGGRIVDASGKLNFKEFFSLIRLSDLVVSADTAAVHVASAFGIPVVGLYGPNTPVLYGPWGENSLSFYRKLDCSPCITNFNSKIFICRHPEGRGACMLKISAEEVYEKIRERYFEQNSANRLRKLSGREACTR